jgi:hypothetical protein
MVKKSIARLLKALEKELSQVNTNIDDIDCAYARVDNFKYRLLRYFVSRKA